MKFNDTRKERPSIPSYSYGHLTSEEMHKQVRDKNGSVWASDTEGRIYNVHPWLNGGYPIRWQASRWDAKNLGELLEDLEIEVE